MPEVPASRPPAAAADATVAAVLVFVSFCRSAFLGMRMQLHRDLYMCECPVEVALLTV